jgi:hypothetical protein
MYSGTSGIDSWERKKDMEKTGKNRKRSDKRKRSNKISAGIG